MHTEEEQIKIFIVMEKFCNEIITNKNLKYQQVDSFFFSEFHIIVCGLDSVAARRWINGMAVSIGLLALTHYVVFHSVESTEVQ